MWYCVCGGYTFNVHVSVLHVLFQERNYRLNSRTYDIPLEKLKLASRCGKYLNSVHV